MKYKTVKELAEKYGIKPNTIYVLVRRNLVKHTEKTGVLIDEDSLKEYLRDHEVKGENKIALVLDENININLPRRWKRVVVVDREIPYEKFAINSQRLQNEEELARILYVLFGEGATYKIVGTHKRFSKDQIKEALQKYKWKEH